MPAESDKAKMASSQQEPPEAASEALKDQRLSEMKKKSGKAQSRHTKVSLKPELARKGSVQESMHMEEEQYMKAGDCAEQQFQPAAVGEKELKMPLSQGGGNVGCDKQLEGVDKGSAKQRACEPRSAAERAWLARERAQGRNEEAAYARWEAGRQAWLKRLQRRDEKARWEARRQVWLRRKARKEKRKRRKQNGCIVQAKKQHATAAAAAVAVEEQSMLMDEQAVAVAVEEQAVVLEKQAEQRDNMKPGKLVDTVASGGARPGGQVQ
jgi:hypothetical protein